MIIDSILGFRIVYGAKIMFFGYLLVILASVRKFKQYKTWKKEKSCLAA